MNARSEPPTLASMPPHAAASAPANLPVLPWWRVRMVWLVLAGPALVVVASFATLALAISHPDPVIGAKTKADPATMPAVAARNHAAQPPR